MDRRYSTEITRSVWNDKEGVAIKVGPDGDGLDLVWVRTDAKAGEFYGNCDMRLSAGMAAELGRALIAASIESEAAMKQLLGEAK